MSNPQSTNNLSDVASIAASRANLRSGTNVGSDTTHSAPVAAGERVSLKVTSTSSAAATSIAFGFQIDPS